MKSNYHEAKASKIEKFEELSSKHADAANSHFTASSKAVDGIPLGQPILVGHHSERHHRAAVNRSHNQMQKAVDSTSKSGYYADKANTMKNNKSISSDNPDAVSLLQEKLSSLEKQRDDMKAINKIFRSKKLSETEKFSALEEKYNMSFSKFQMMLKPQYSFEKPGFASYTLTNLGAKIRNVAKRVEELLREETQDNLSCDFVGGHLVDSKEDNRFQFFFDDKPNEEIRKHLKMYSFKWSPNLSAWIRLRNGASRRSISSILVFLETHSSN